MVSKIAVIMKKFLILFGLMAFCRASCALPVQVQYIIDGDTFVGDIFFENDIAVMSVPVRLINVDTPEIHGECDEEIEKAIAAKERLSELIPIGSIVEIKNIKDDKYAGRIDANVFDSENRDVGLILVREKLGRAYSGGKRRSWCN